MENKLYRVIDIENWPRKTHCAIFQNSLMPHYCVSFDLDITSFHQKIKDRNLPFSLTLIYKVAECANEIENFRYRFEDGKVVLYDRIGTSFAYLEKGSDLFKRLIVKSSWTLE